MPRMKKTVTFHVPGHEMVEKIVRPASSSGRVYLPARWIGKRVKVIRIDD